MRQNEPQSASIPQQQSPFRNKFAHLSQMEQISQFDNNDEEPFQEDSEFMSQVGHPNARNSHLLEDNTENNRNY